MRRVATLVLLAGLLSCGTGRSPLASPAAKDVHQRAVTAGFAMAKAGRTSSAALHAYRVVGDTGTARIDALEVEGDGIKGHVLLRISVTVPSAGFAKGSHATGCFRYDLGGIDSVRPHEVECPDKPALVLPEPTPEPTLPPDSQDRLRRALSAADPAAALTRVFQGTRAVVGTAVTGGIVGAAVLAGRDECLFGRRLADKTIEIWVVPRVLAQPGELGCGAEFAAAGDGKTPPH